MFHLFKRFVIRTIRLVVNLVKLPKMFKLLYLSFNFYIESNKMGINECFLNLFLIRLLAFKLKNI